MDEILSKLLSSELLSEDAKAEISSQWEVAVNAHKELVREAVTLEVREELAEQWTQERDALVESLDEFVSSALSTELKEFADDVERFRDLEVEYAAKLVEAQTDLASKFDEELDSLVDKIDAFFELRLTEEFAEMKEDLQIVKQNDFGRRMFEAAAAEFAANFVDEDSVQSQLTVTESKLQEVERALARAEADRAALIRESKMTEVLADLSGKKREQMKFVLQNVETSRLAEAYSRFIGKVLKEEAAPVSVTESVVQTVKVTGEETAQVITESVKSADASAKAAMFAELRKLAGNA